jgi:hypothetical protein
MKGAGLRLAVFALLFAAWMGYLAHLVLESRSPVILSRPQFLIANVVVTADVQQPADAPVQVTIRKVWWPHALADHLTGQTIYLPSAVPVYQGCTAALVVPPFVNPAASIFVALQAPAALYVTACEGWQGPGQYILPLEQVSGKSFRVAPIPPSPGFYMPRPRIYPDTPEVEAQLPEIEKLMPQ